MMSFKGFILCVLGVFALSIAKAQFPDSSLAPVDTAGQQMPLRMIPTDSSSVDLITQSAHSPKKAVRYSAMLPGLGQAYNKKYWKIPLIYGLGAYTVYSATSNHKQYIRYRNAYRLRVDDDPNTVDEFLGVENTLVVRQKRDEFRQARDLNWIFTAVVYVLNLVDASVDAHLFDFDVSDDLSFQILPPPAAYNFAVQPWHVPIATIRIRL